MLSALLAGPRSDVDHPVSGSDGVLVVLDDDQGVADVPQPEQRLDQPVVVPLMQPDRRLVKDVEHADQTGSDLRGEPDPLRLAAGQRGRGAIEREVVEPDVDQEPQPGLHLLQHPLGDEPLSVGELDLSEKVGGLANGQRGYVGDRPVRDRHRQDLGLQPGALTGWAGHLAHVALVLLAGVVAVGLGVPALDPRDDALVAGVVRAIAAVAVPVPDMHLLVQAVQDGLLRSSREPLPRRVQVEALGVGHTLQQPQEVLARLTGCPGRDRPVAQGGLRIGDDELRVDLFPGPEPGADRTCAER